jgi:hypothetical protein
VKYTERHDRGLDAFLGLADSGWYWPFTGVVILTERPTALHRDVQGRLHHVDGPAMAYGDGTAIHAWHGTRVPPDLLDGWPMERILAEPNQEVRRCAIEAVGWDRFVVDAGLSAVDEADDPGNPGQRIGLYDIPDAINPYPARVRLLLWVNGTTDRDGTRRRGGLTVPADVPDAVTAASWTYGVDKETYLQLERRT